MNKLLTLFFVSLTTIVNAQFIRFNNLNNGTLTGTNVNTGIISGGSITGISNLNGTGNLTFDAGTGNNVLTLRTGTITHNGTNFTFNNASTFSGSVTGTIFVANATNQSNTGSTTGLKFQAPAFTANSSTAQNGTDAFSSNISIGVPTLTATNTGITTTTAANLYIAGDPVAGTNQTLTSSYGLYNNGKTYLNGSLQVSGSSFLSIIKPFLTTIDFQAGNNTLWARFGTSGNFLIGTGTDDGTNKLQVNGNSSFVGNINSSASVIAQNLNATGNRTRNVNTDGPGGLHVSDISFTNNDPSSAANTTTPLVVSHGIGIPTLSAVNSGQIYTNASNLYITGPPVAGTNVTIGNAYSLYVNSGRIYSGGGLVNASGAIYSNFFQSYGSDMTLGNVSGTYYAKIMTANGNMLLQNGGTFTDDGVNRLQVIGNIKATKLVGSSTTPTFIAGVGMGTSPSGITVSGNDMGGKITFTTGTSPTSGIIGTLTFSSAYPAAPIAIVEGANSIAKVGNTLWFVGTETTTTVPINNTSGNTLQASTQYVLNYQIVGR